MLHCPLTLALSPGEKPRDTPPGTAHTRRSQETKKRKTKTHNFFDSEGERVGSIFFSASRCGEFPSPDRVVKTLSLSLPSHSLSLSLSLSRRTSKVSATPLFFSASLSPSSPRRRRASALLEGSLSLEVSLFRGGRPQARDRSSRGNPPPPLWGRRCLPRQKCPLPSSSPPCARETRARSTPSSRSAPLFPMGSSSRRREGPSTGKRKKEGECGCVVVRGVSSTMLDNDKASAFSDALVFSAPSPRRWLSRPDRGEGFPVPRPVIRSWSN